MAVTISGSGQIIKQVIQTVKTDAFTSTVNNTWTDITGFNATITPTNSLNKILITVAISAQGGQVNYPRGFVLVRGSTQICVADAGTGTEATFCLPELPGGRDVVTIPMTFLDSPATTSSTTYKVQFLNPPSSSTGIFINRGSTQDSNSFNGTSTITLYEVAYA